ncbi:MAG: putative lipid II flippase FtsW [Spirochaetaceae bacterium]|jgi:cell division protein FtsW|nr:putative lipid II flippase FtsW [Spirochaetaceae bacterium]
MAIELQAERGLQKMKVDSYLVLAVFMLTALGLVTLYSGSYAFAKRFFNDGFYFVSRQLIFGAVGVLLFFIASYIPLDSVRRFIVPLVLGTIILCVLTFVPGVGISKNGASRWIGIGSFSYQPSEMVKLVLPIYLAHIFDKKKEDVNSFMKAVLPPTLMTVLFFALIYMQNNFSTALFVVLNALVVFFLAGVRIRYFVMAIALIIPVSALLILTRTHRLTRFISFMNPDWDPLGAGYQVRASVLTIESGGFWGKGIGQGTRKLTSVPEIQSDFIFSAFAEELGFVGVLLFFILFAFFVYRGYKASLASESLFGRLLAFGLVTTIASQTLLNICVTSGAIPATGIPLPFFSAGGSALVTTLVSAGLVVNVSRKEASVYG